MGNEMIIRALAVANHHRPEERAVTHGTATMEQACYSQGRTDALRDLVEILYPSLDSERRAALLMDAVHGVLVRESTHRRDSY